MCQNVLADLHVHTENSDGLVTLDEIPDICKENNLEAIAITDHDRTHPKLNSPIKIINGIEIISGLELRVETDDSQRLDILGYGVEPNNSMKDMLNKIQQDRINRSYEMIDRIEKRTGVRVDVDVSDNTGRPHIAQAISENSDLDYDYNEAFDDLIGSDCYAYVSRDIPSFNEGVRLMNKCCHHTSLAHPFRYDNPISALKYSKELDCLEYNYIYDTDIDSEYDDIAIQWFDLGITGGSDSHDIESIGSCGLSEDEYRNFLVKSGLDEYSKFY